ncbi:unnamed protein product [Effrenium voratum]|uniref:Hexosyltransferase n=2 Tax=Effrenium voratum TaxID=2562239 RepID=A0AA36JSX1_9DINO|nr:unnamed protein product [Effrenium voratum]
MSPPVQEELNGDTAYVSLLHGDRVEFWLYALMLGHRLRQLDQATPRVLLVARPTEDYAAPFLEGMSYKCLQALWEVRPVDLVDAAAADKTRRKRHRYVFTKLRVFEVPYKHIMFFDLDVVVRRDPSELFKVSAPAGMYHGRWDRSEFASHGGLLPQEAFEKDDCVRGCVNAGLLRLDPPVTSVERRELLDEMLREVAKLKEDDQSYLPEQYFLVKQIPNWHHIKVAWNCEVNPRWSVVERHKGNSKLEKCREVIKAELPRDWFELCETQEQLRSVGMFHFSGLWLQPWWYLNMPPTEAHQQLKKQFDKRDPPGMVALAVAEWLLAAQELKESAVFSEDETYCFKQQLGMLERTAEKWWDGVQSCNACGAIQDDYDESCEECEVSAHLARVVERSESATVSTSKGRRQNWDLGGNKKRRQRKKAEKDSMELAESRCRRPSPELGLSSQ